MKNTIFGTTVLALVVLLTGGCDSQPRPKGDAQTLFCH